VARLIQKADELGYEVTLGECWRPPEMAAVYAEQGKGITNSLHWSRLAIDLNLFRDGKFLSRSEDHRELGIWWERQSTDEYTLHWGGRWGDGNHYSLGWNGVR
jgi:hypothetical protein